MFRTDELAAAHPERDGGRRSLDAFLRAQTRAGRIERLRRGLYRSLVATACPGGAIEPQVVAAKAYTDGVLAYHTALEAWGVAHTAHRDVIVVADTTPRTFQVAGARVRVVRPPAGIGDRSAATEWTIVTTRCGLDVRATNAERTFVDCLDRVDLAGGTEEVANSLPSFAGLDIDLAIRYVVLLRNRTTAARVGYFLERHADRWAPTAGQIDALRALAPAGPHYAAPSARKGGRFIPGWNIVVPSDWVDDGQAVPCD